MEKRHLPDGCYDDAMAKIEVRDPALGARIGAILWKAVVVGLDGGVEVGGIVNGFRPGVGGLELQTVREALSELGLEGVVDRTSAVVMKVDLVKSRVEAVVPDTVFNQEGRLKLS